MMESIKKAVDVVTELVSQTPTSKEKTLKRANKNDEEVEASLLPTG